MVTVWRVDVKYKILDPPSSPSLINFNGFCGDTLQDSTDDSSIGKVETSLERQEHISQFQDTTDALPLSHSSSCVLVNHGLSQQSCKEEYEPWK